MEIKKQNKKLEILMLDAFKPEYLKYAPYLSSLIKKYQWGELEMPTGHWGGEEIVFKGDSTNLCLFYRTDKSKIRWVRYFTWLDYFKGVGRFIIDCMINLPRLLRGYEIIRTGKIPLNRLWKFDFCVNKPFYKIPGIKKRYFSDVDVAGHKYGTKDKRTIEAIKRLDEKLSKLRCDIIFSDHGMINVSQTVKVPETRDCFVDSDMARYWGSKEELEEVKNKLPMKYGKIINWPDKRFGDLIFLANPGVLISPSFWYGNKLVKGMHGYNGKNKDMRGMYILKRLGKKKNINAKQFNRIIESERSKRRGSK